MQLLRSLKLPEPSAGVDTSLGLFSYPRY